MQATDFSEQSNKDIQGAVVFKQHGALFLLMSPEIVKKILKNNCKVDIEYKM